jgi:hypothetical protein
VEDSSGAWAAEALLEDSTAERSAAAALLERLRTTGMRRRRSGTERGAAPAAPAVSAGTAPAAPAAPAEAVVARPAAVPPEPPPAPEPASGRFGRGRRPGGSPPAEAPRGPGPDPETSVVDLLPVGALPTLDLDPRAVSAAAPSPSPAPPPPAVVTAAPSAPPPATVEIAAGDRRIELQLRAEESVGSAALRAAVELGGLPLDALGRLSGAVRLRRGGRTLSSATTAEAGARYELELVACEVRIVELEVETEPPTRLRLPVSLAMPSGWLVRHLASWLALPPGAWVLRVEGAPADPHAPLVEVLGSGAALRLSRT